MIIKRNEIMNASNYFPIDYDEFLEIVRKSNKRFYAFNGKVFDIKKKYIDNNGHLNYKKAICEIEETDGHGFDYVLDTIIISGFPAVGKSQFVKDHKELIVLDSDSSNFSWIKDEQGNNTKVRNPEFPQCYISHIKENIGKVDIILVSSHDVVRKALYDSNIKYYLVYPSKTLKEEYMNRYVKRGNDYNFIKVVDNNWDKWIEDIENETFPFLIKLWENQYLNDLFNEIPVCKEYHELCSVKETNADEYPSICHRCNCKSGFAKLRLNKIKEKF